MKKSGKQLSLFHLNISTPPFSFNDLASVLQGNELKFDIAGISESHLIQDSSAIHEIYKEEYNIEHTLTKSYYGGTFSYINDSLSYKVRKDLVIYKEKPLNLIL